MKLCKYCDEVFNLCHKKSCYKFLRKCDGGYCYEYQPRPDEILIDYSCFKQPRYGFNKNIESIDLTNEIPVIKIFSGFLVLNRHYIQDMFLWLKNVRKNDKVRVLVAYNTNNKTYYMAKCQLEAYVNRRILLNAKFTFSAEVSSDVSIYNFSPASELKLYGYSVGKSSTLSQSARWELLDYLIDNNLVSAFKIIDYLNQFIALRDSYRYEQAIMDWRMDLEYVIFHHQDAPGVPKIEKIKRKNFKKVFEDRIQTIEAGKIPDDLFTYTLEEAIRMFR